MMLVALVKVEGSSTLQRKTNQRARRNIIQSQYFFRFVGYCLVRRHGEAQERDAKEMHAKPHGAERKLCLEPLHAKSRFAEFRESDAESPRPVGSQIEAQNDVP